MPVQTERTKDTHGWIGTETINTRFGNFDEVDLELGVKKEGQK